MSPIKNNVDLLLKVKELSKNNNLTCEEIEILHEKKFKKLLKYVLTHSKFYQHYYGERGITLEKINEVLLEDLPVIDKKIVMENFDDIVCDRALKRKELEAFSSNSANRNKKYKNYYNVIRSSGSSGEVGIFVYNDSEWNYIKALNIERTSKVKLKLFSRTKVAFIGNVHHNLAGVSLVKELPALFSRKLLVDINMSLEEIAGQVNEFQPEILTGYASGINSLAQAQIEGKINISPEKILCSGEVLTDYMREQIKKAFCVEPTNLYAASEALGMACECKLNNNLHLFNDLYKFEVVDIDLKGVQPGNFGNLLITNLFNYTQPLIRYKMSDEVLLDDTPCGCDWKFPIIKSISGRQEEFLWFEKSDGTKEFIHPSAIRWCYVPGVEKIKVIQISYNSLLIKIIINGNKEGAIDEFNKKFCEILKSKGLDKDVTFKIEKVSELKNDTKTGKYKIIVPLNN